MQLRKSRNRMCIAVILIHCLFDFDLQYTSMWMILILLCSFETKLKILEINKAFLHFVPSAVLTVFFIYFTILFMMEYLGNYEKAVAMYPAFTEAKCSLLMETGDADRARELADNILASNSHISTAYDAKALAAYSEGDIEQFCTYKEKVLEIEKYDITQYEDYVLLLYGAAEDAYNAGDEELMEFCLERVQSVPEKLLEELKENTSPLAYKIKDKPVFEMFSE
jgi:tetratricopeptide (TPR) repeat protein